MCVLGLLWGYPDAYCVSEASFLQSKWDFQTIV